jgi:Ni,Fe-hydrogenase III component G
MIDATFQIQIKGEIVWKKPPKDTSEEVKRNQLQTYFDHFLYSQQRQLVELIGKSTDDMTPKDAIRMLLEVDGKQQSDSG